VLVQFHIHLFWLEGP